MPIRRQLLLLLAGAAVGVAPLVGQTRADSAAIVLDAARTLRQDGRLDAARELLQLLRIRYGGTPAVAHADSLLGVLETEAPLTRATGRTGFILFHTIYGGFLGVAIPAAFGADQSEPYGVGLLIGGPAGYFGSRAFARSHITMPGQAGIASFATLWGTWQGVALQQVLNIGEPEVCPAGPDSCYRPGSDTAPWAAAIVGGLAGLGTGLALTSREIPSGTSSLISQAAFWGSWFGLAAGAIIGAEGEGLLAAALVGGDAAVLAAIPAARAWRPSPSRVRLATAAGIAGGLAGLGIDLLANIEDDQAAFAVAAAGSATGLLAGAWMGRGRTDEPQGEEATLALLTVRDGSGVRFRAPVPVPAALPVEERGKRSLRPGLRVLLLDADF